MVNRKEGPLLYGSHGHKYASEYYQLVKEETDAYNRIYAFQNLGSINRNLEYYDSAEYYWQQAIALAENSNYAESYIHTVLLNNLGELYSQLEIYGLISLLLQK